MLDREAMARMAAGDALELIGRQVAAAPALEFACPLETCRAVVHEEESLGERG